MIWLAGIALGAGLWAGFLYCVHLLFVRTTARRIAAGAVFQRRVRQHALRQGRWS